MEIKAGPPPKQILDKIDSSREAIVSGRARGAPALDNYLSAYTDFFSNIVEMTTDPKARVDAKTQLDKHQQVLEGDAKTKEAYCFQIAQGLAAGSATLDKMAHNEKNPEFAKQAQRKRNEAVQWLLFSSTLTNQETSEQT